MSGSGWLWKIAGPRSASVSSQTAQFSRSRRRSSTASLMAFGITERAYRYSTSIDTALERLEAKLEQLPLVLLVRELPLELIDACAESAH